MKNFVVKWLAGLARKLIAKHNPKIIGITGSVGKTSTRDAVYAVVSTAFWARKGAKNLNNEFGLPLTIIGSDSPGRSIFGWLRVFFKAYWQLWFGSFPKVLVLEMGVDHPGDMDYLLSIAKPHISILTSIGISHYEFFGSQEAVVQEKGKLIEALTESGTAIINADNEKSFSLRNKSKAKVISYGFSDKSDVRVNIKTEQFITPPQTELDVHTSTQNFEVTVPVVGVPHLSASAAAIATGLSLGLPLEKIQSGLSKYRAVPGRLNLISGIKKTLLIDDSYNASPDSVKEALEILRRMPHHNKTIVLGDMLELGEQSQHAHQEIGKLVKSVNPTALITVGSLGKTIADSAVAGGLNSEVVHSYGNSREAAEFLRDNLIQDSAVLIKGSQGVRMELITKELLADPMSAKKVLPRQYGKWLEG